MIHLDYRDARPIYLQICDGFLEQIHKGILCPGEKLPSVRELATQLTINPNTIQRAYRELELQGWVASVPGKGSFVCEAAYLRQIEGDKLLHEWEKTTKKLLELGLTPEELIQRLQQGGTIDA